MEGERRIPLFRVSELDPSELAEVNVLLSELENYYIIQDSKSNWEAVGMLIELREIAQLISQSERGWYNLKPDFKRILGKKNALELVQEFELELDSLPPKDLPNASLIFYLAFTTNYEDIGYPKLVEIVKFKRSYTLMKKGLEIFLLGKSKKINYVAELTDDRFRNKYEYLENTIDSIWDFEMHFRGFFNLLELIYYEDRAEFWKLLSKDVNNLFVIYNLINRRLSFTNHELKPFLESEDKIKSNSAFYYLLRRLDSYISKQGYTTENFQAQTMETEIADIEKVIDEISNNAKAHLLINYVFSDNRMPVFFVGMLESVEQELILKEIEAKELTNLYKLRHIIKIMNVLEDIQYSELFIKHFTIWTQEDANSNIWSSLKGDIQSIFDLLPTVHQEYLIRELCSIEKNLFVTSFDRQVRYALYLRDINKKDVIEEVLGWVKE